MKAKATVLYDETKVWQEEYNEVRVIVIRFNCKDAPRPVTQIYIKHEFVAVDGQDTLNQRREIGTWSDSKAIRAGIESFDELVQAHPCTYLKETEPATPTPAQINDEMPF